MKCPHCGAWSTVLATRATRRRRECANGHRFNTVETVLGLSGNRVQKWARNQAIRADERGNSELARIHNVSEARIREIRRLPCAASS